MGPKFNATKTKTPKENERPKSICFQATIAESAADFPLMEGMHTQGSYHHKGVIKHLIMTLKWSFLSMYNYAHPSVIIPPYQTSSQEILFASGIFNNQQNPVIYVH